MGVFVRAFRAVAFVWVALCCALLNVSSASASGLAEPQAESVDPATLPAIESASLDPVAELPEGQGGPVVGDRTESPKPDPNATRVSEVVEKRTDRNRVWERSDGLFEAQLSADPIAFKSGDGSYELIDTSVRGDGEHKGWLISGANAWSVSFGPSDQGVAITTPKGKTLRSRPSAAAGVAPAKVVVPVVDQMDASVVWYRQVWPGIDLRYTVTTTSVKEDVVFTERPKGSSAVEFAVSGAELDAVWNMPSADVPEAGTVAPGDVFQRAAPELDLSADSRPSRPPVGSSGASLVARGELAAEVQFATVVVATALPATQDEAPITAGADPLVRSAVVAPGESLVEVSVDDAWMAELPEKAFPVVIDPDVVLGGGYWASYRSDGGIVCGSPNLYPSACSPFTSYDPWGFNGFWRGLVGFDFSPMMGEQILDADLRLYTIGGTATPCWVQAHVAQGLNYWSVAPTNSSLGSVALGTYGEIDLTGWVQNWMLNGQNPGIGLTGYEAGPSGCFKVTSADMHIIYNHYPPKAPISGSSIGDGARYVAPSPVSSPTIAVNAVTDADGQTPLYWLVVDDQPNPTQNNPGNVVQQTWSTSRSLQIPAHRLEDGKTYWWRAFTWDQTNNNAVTSGDVYSFSFDRRLGTSQPSPYDSAGPVTVNLSNGNAVFGWSSRQAGAVGGSLGVGLTYNSVVNASGSSAAPQAGMASGWVPSWGSVGPVSVSVSPNATAVVRFVDGSSQSFVRSASGSAWQPDDPFEYDALFDVPGGGWTYQDGGGTLSEFASDGSLRSTITATDDRKPAALRYQWTTGGLLRRIFDPVVSTNTASPTTLRQVELSYGGDTAGTNPLTNVTNPCPTTGLAAGVAPAPTAKLCRITHVGGAITELMYNSSGQLIRLVSPGSEVTDLAYDSAGRLSTVRAPLAADAV